MMNRIGILCLLTLLFAQTACSASFDCDKASTEVEKMICADVELSKLDGELGKTYSEALKKSSDLSSLKQQQRDWLKERNGCADARCLKAQYQQRMGELEFEKPIKQTEMATALAESDNNAFCANMKNEVHTIESQRKNAKGQVFNIYVIDKYQMHEDIAFPGVFPQIDIDKDGLNDELIKSCSASTIAPADRCLFLVKLSSGARYQLDGWNMSLIYYQAKYYVLTHHDDKARSQMFTKSQNPEEGVIFHPEIVDSIKYELYRLDVAGAPLICKGL